MSNAVIRAFRPADEDRVREICFNTALYGRPIGSVLDDSRLVTDALIGYHIRFEPESLFVAEVDGRVAGYLSGCLSDARFQRLYATRVAPRLALRFVTRGHWLRFRVRRLFDASVTLAGRARAARKGRLDAYPAHLHTNLDPGAQGRGIGSALIEAFFARLRDRRIGGVHLSTGTEGGKAFFAKHGFERLATYAAPAFLDQAERDIWLMGKKLEG
jgi:ribosomal protein S18 acetylase RimI-like enzyme